MAQATDPADLGALYQRAADAPVWTGDHVAHARVIGFALIREPEPADQVLVEGEEDVVEPPCRPVPDPADPDAAIRRSGPSAVQGVAQVNLHKGAGYVVEVIEQQLIALGADGEFIRWVLAEVANRKHLAWYVGGAVRDILADGPGAHVSDLDFTGTIGPGELSQIVRQRSRGQGAGDYRQRISARLVWSVTPPARPKDRVMEYKPLVKAGFRFPAWGGDLACDSATRDLTVNALYYDSRQNVVADPTGRGVTDLCRTPRTAFVPYHGGDPVEQACIIVRCLKFRLRWPDLDLRAAARWTDALPEDLVTRIPADQWKQVVQLRNRCIPEPDKGGGELAIAAELGTTARQLIEAIQARAAM